MSIPIHREYDPNDWAYDRTHTAWIAIQGQHSGGRGLFVARAARPQFGEGRWAVYLRMPDRLSESYVDRPLHLSGFRTADDAEDDLQRRALADLGWRLARSSHEQLPTEWSSDLHPKLDEYPVQN